MARPVKRGIDYFPLDVDISSDDKIRLVEAEFGLGGFAVIIKLFCKIYDNGYYYRWTSAERLLFASETKLDMSILDGIVGRAVQWGLFDEGILTDHEVLTSQGIQERYFNAIKRRVEVDANTDYLLLQSKKKKISGKNTETPVNVTETIVNVCNNPVNVCNNEFMSTFSTQRKEKKSKVKNNTSYSSYSSSIQNTQNYSSSFDDANDCEEEVEGVKIDGEVKGQRIDYKAIGRYWNALDKGSIPDLKTITPQRQQSIKARITETSLEDFYTMMDNVAKSPFLKGEVSDFRADFGWCIRPTNYPKVLEGNYLDKQREPTARPHNDNSDGIDYSKYYYPQNSKAK